MHQNKVLRFKDVQVRLIDYTKIARRCECKGGWLFLSQPCDELATRHGCFPGIKMEYSFYC